MSDKIKPWNSKTLHDALVLSSQIQQKIEDICDEHGVESIDQLPDSLIPTDKLYLLALCFSAVYETLLNHELVKTGNPKPTNKMQ